jgi:hypothetical protein
MMASTINALTSGGGVAITGDTSGQLQLQTNNGTTAVTINAVQGVQALNCIGIGNATPSTSGAGISFPATQSASSDANTLDDYEKGTFTATLRIGGTSNGTTTGAYTKIGRVVTYDINFYNGSYTKSGTGALTITGMPFTSASSNYYMGQVGFFNTYNSSTAGFPFLELANNTTTLTFQRQAADNFGAITDTLFSNGTLLIRVSGTYIV